MAAPDVDSGRGAREVLPDSGMTSFVNCNAVQIGRGRVGLAEACDHDCFLRARRCGTRLTSNSRVACSSTSRPRVATRASTLEAEGEVKN